MISGGATVNTIGGTAAGAGNIIAFNGGPGVATSPGTTGATIRFNAIFSNGGPGIDRNDDGVTPNTPNGANNTPVLASASGGIVTGSSTPRPIAPTSSTSTPTSRVTPRPRGPRVATILTSTTVATNAAGDAVFNVPYTPFPGEPILTATATDAAGTTSEFSPPLGYVLTATGVTFAATTRVPFHGTVASFTSSDPTATAADFTATINYGDGSPQPPSGTVVAAPGGFVVVGSHTFTTANPAEPVTVTITDTLGFGQATANSVANVTSPGGVLTPFGQSAPFVAGTLYSAVVASFTDSSPLAVPGEFTATINWGDGTASSAGTIAVSGAGFRSPARTLTTSTRSRCPHRRIRHRDHHGRSDRRHGHGQLDRHGRAGADHHPDPEFRRDRRHGLLGDRGHLHRRRLAHQSRVLHRHDQLGRRHAQYDGHDHRHQPVHRDRVAHLRDVPEHRPRDHHDHRQERAHGHRRRSRGRPAGRLRARNGRADRTGGARRPGHDAPLCWRSPRTR